MVKKLKPCPKCTGTLVALQSDKAHECLWQGACMKNVEKELANTLMARDYKDPQVVNDTPNGEVLYIVRRLTPTECARLQGFPDWWCRDLATQDPSDEEVAFWIEVWKTWNELNNKKPKSEKQVRKWLANPYTESAEYAMWGNGICLQTGFFVLAGIVWAESLQRTEIHSERQNGRQEKPAIPDVPENCIQSEYSVAV